MHFIDTQDLGPDTIRAQMELIGLLKQADKQNACPRLLEGASLGMIFEEASTRTRVSFEVAMTKLGGHALYLKPGEIHLGQKENIKDTAEVLSRMVDAVEIRASSTPQSPTSPSTPRCRSSTGLRTTTTRPRPCATCSP